jgi:hypothetical protein
MFVEVVACCSFKYASAGVFYLELTKHTMEQDAILRTVDEESELQVKILLLINHFSTLS